MGGTTPMPRFSAGSIAALVAVLWTFAPAQSTDIEPAPPADEWTFTIAPDLWAAGLSGDIGLFGRQPVEVDMNFSDILHDLKFGGMVVGEAHASSRSPLRWISLCCSTSLRFPLR